VALPVGSRQQIPVSHQFARRGSGDALYHGTPRSLGGRVRRSMLVRAHRAQNRVVAASTSWKPPHTHCPRAGAPPLGATHDRHPGSRSPVRLVMTCHCNSEQVRGPRSRSSCNHTYTCPLVAQADESRSASWLLPRRHASWTRVLPRPHRQETRQPPGPLMRWLTFSSW